MTSPAPAKLSRNLTVCVIALGLALLWTSAALAHAELLSTDPAAGAVVDTAPAKVTLRFSEPVDLTPDAVAVTGPNGQRVDRGPARHAPGEPSTLEVDIDDQGNGTYRVQWRAISADGHPVGGTFSFSVGVQSTPAVPEAQEAGPGLPLLAVSRWLHLLALSLAIGPAIYALFPPRPAGKAQARLVHAAFAGSMLLLTANAVMLVGQTVAIGGSLSALMDGELMAAILSSRWGLLWAGRLMTSVLLALTAAAAFAKAMEGQTATALWAMKLFFGTVLLGLTALNSHAVVTAPVWVSLTADFLHLGAAVVWVGSLISFTVGDLPQLLQQAKQARLRALASPFSRLSALSAASMQVLAVTGLYSAWVQAKAPTALISVPYGNVLLAKMALVGCALLVGAYHLFVAHPRLYAEVIPARAPRNLPRTLGLEIAIATAILLASGLLTAMPPVSSAGALPSQEARRPEITLADNAGSTMVTLEVFRQATHPIRLELKDLYGNPVAGAQVQVTVRNLGNRAVGATKVWAHDLGAGLYSAPVYLSPPGLWEIDVSVWTGGSESAVSFTVPIPTSGAKELLALSDKAMNRLRSLSGDEVITDGRATVRTHYEFRAPDQMHMVVEGAQRLEMYAFGKVRYFRTDPGSWAQEPWPTEEGFRWPFYNFSSGAEDVLLLGREEVDGTDCFVLAFRHASSGAMYRLWTGVSDHLIRKYRMILPGHYMTVRYYDFDRPVSISPPQL